MEWQQKISSPVRGSRKGLWEGLCSPRRGAQLRKPSLYSRRDCARSTKTHASSPHHAQGACLPDARHVQASRASRWSPFLGHAGGAVWGLHETRYPYTQSILVVTAPLHGQEVPPLEIDWAEIVGVPQSLASLPCSLVPTAIPPTPVADPALTSPRRPTPSGGLGCVLPAPMCCTWRESGEVRANLASSGVTQLGQRFLGASKDPRCPHFPPLPFTSQSRLCTRCPG